MLSKGPHISIQSESLVPRILRINEKEFAAWPEAVRRLAVEIASELFLVRYNPFIASSLVRKSVDERFEASRKGLAQHYAAAVSEGITMFWSAHESDMDFRKEVIKQLSAILPPEHIDTRNHSLVETATDATDLRLELPLLVITPSNAEQISAVVRLANEMQFALVPRGGGSGATGGAVPARKRSVILSLTKMTAITDIDTENLTITAQAGVITNNACLAAAAHGLLLSVDPASKQASSIGGNIAENAGGPLCFEYGTTIDNILSYRMVTPTGEIIEITRKDHPRHAIRPDETAVFEVRDITGGLRSVVKLAPEEIRTPGLGKDVTNKTLGGLPGLQKEGTDGVITDATLTLHKSLAHHKVVVLEFFGRSMENCMLVVTDIVAMRDDIRRRGDLVKITALEEFNVKYVQAINYAKKSVRYEGDPISVLILQLDSDDQNALDEAVSHVVDICNDYDGVDTFVAKDDKEGELFWEDRHKLSAIAKRTSGFKINEDVVIPIRAIPDFALFLEGINLEYMGRAYRSALQQAGNLPGIPEEDHRIIDELGYAKRIIQGEIPSCDLSDQELQLHAILFLRSLGESYPSLAGQLDAIEKHLVGTCICVASHMHAGDGNWHVNIPVNSNDPEMMHNAETVAALVMKKAQELGGEVTGEHGIGITKIAFLTQAKLEAFKEYKELVDPKNIFNPSKLMQRELPVAPFTFSFNRLIQDIGHSGLQDKEQLIALLTNIQVCTRCGKCKQHCPMYYPEESLLYHARNKNIILGALIEAIYYSQINTGRPDPFLLSELQNLVEHCTGCGKCVSTCPVKINSSEVALALLSYVQHEGASGHPLKQRALKMVSRSPQTRIPLAGKAAAIGQGVQNKILSAVPASWRSRFVSPLFSHPGPRTGFRNLMETLDLNKGSLFVPEGEVKGTVLYFPGCGGAVFFRYIGLAGIVLLLEAGYAVMLPEHHLCCGYPLLAAGNHDEFAENQDKNITHLRYLAHKAAEKGYPVTHLLTACGSCRDGMERHFIPEVFPTHEGKQVELGDVAYFLLTRMSQNAPGASADSAAGGSAGVPAPAGAQQILYHSPCHAALPNVHKVKAAGMYAKALAGALRVNVAVSPGCCGESGMGAMTSPAIYNKLRAKKARQLDLDYASLPADTPIVVGCPSCKMGLVRIGLQQKKKRRVLHTLEYMAAVATKGPWRKKFKKLLRGAVLENGVRKVKVASLSSLQLSKQEEAENDES